MFFSESTRNALKYYVDSDFPQWESTLNFLNLIAKWWNKLNVKSPSKGKQKRDKDSEPITKDNFAELGFFAKIIDWLFEWQSSHEMSVETFKTFKQTTKTFPSSPDTYLMRNTCPIF